MPARGGRAKSTRTLATRLGALMPIAIGLACAHGGGGPSAASGPQAPREGSVAEGMSATAPRPVARSADPGVARPEVGVATSGPPGVEPGPVRQTPAYRAPGKVLEAVAGGPRLVVTAEVPTGVQPKSVAVSVDGRWVVVCNFGYAGRKNVYVYDADRLSLEGAVAFAGNAVETAFDGDGRHLYVSNFHRGVLEVIDLVERRLVTEIKVGVNPKVVAVDAARDLIYVANWSSHDVTVIDAVKRQRARTLPTGAHPRGLAVARDGTLYVDVMWRHRVDVFVHGQGDAARSFPVCRYPRHAVLSRDDATLFVSCSGDDMLAWYDTQTGALAGLAHVGRNPRTFALSEDERWAIVANFDESSVSVVDLERLTVRTTPIPGTERIVGLAVAPGAGLRAYITSWGNNRLLQLGLDEG